MPDDRKSKMRAQYPEFAAQVDDLRAHFGDPHAIAIADNRRDPPPGGFQSIRDLLKARPK